jgi:hypothetical protein
MDHSTKILLNSLRCPICTSLIDGNTVSGYCVANMDHYNARIANNTGEPLWIEIPPILVQEQVSIYEGKFRYQIFQSYANLVNNNYVTTDSSRIIIWDVDPEGRIIHSKHRPEFYYNKKLFDFRNTNKEKLINKIKTILVFQ